jgi:Na+/phosphate symporter
MMISETQCQTDILRTEAALRGVQFIDYNQMIQNQQQDLDTLREITRRQGLMDAKSIKELENKINTMEMQIREWLKELGIKSMLGDYAVTILIEQVNK